MRTHGDFNYNSDCSSSDSDNILCSLNQESREVSTRLRNGNINDVNVVIEIYYFIMDVKLLHIVLKLSVQTTHFPKMELQTITPTPKMQLDKTQRVQFDKLMKQ